MTVLASNVTLCCKLEQATRPRVIPHRLDVERGEAGAGGRRDGERVPLVLRDLGDVDPSVSGSTDRHREQRK